MNIAMDFPADGGSNFETQGIVENSTVQSDLSHQALIQGISDLDPNVP